MFSPWQMQPAQMRPMQGRPMQMMMVPMQRMPLLEVPTGAFPVPEAISPEQFPPEVQKSYLRLLEGPPKPCVTLEIMNQTQGSMIAPDLPFKADV